MSAEDAYADAFGPVLAEVASESHGGRITPALLTRMRAAWNLTPSAERAILDAAQRILDGREARA